MASQTCSRAVCASAAMKMTGMGTRKHVFERRAGLSLALEIKSTKASLGLRALTSAID